jgi:hypothetical protein
MTPLSDPQAFAQYLAPAPPARVGRLRQGAVWGAEHVLDYLARYTHGGGAISNSRLVAMTPETVTVHYRDSRQHDQYTRLTLTHEVSSPPPLASWGFQRIRPPAFSATLPGRTTRSVGASWAWRPLLSCRSWLGWTTVRNMSR